MGVWRQHIQPCVPHLLATRSAPQSCRRERDAEALAQFTCSNGLMGVVVEATLQARPLAAITTRLHGLLVNDKLPAKLLKLKVCQGVCQGCVAQCCARASSRRHLARACSAGCAMQEKSDNLFAIISSHGYVYVEQRFAKTLWGRKKPLPGWSW